MRLYRDSPSANPEVACDEFLVRVIDDAHSVVPEQWYAQAVDTTRLPVWHEHRRHRLVKIGGNGTRGDRSAAWDKLEPPRAEGFRKRHPREEAEGRHVCSRWRDCDQGSAPRRYRCDQRSVLSPPHQAFQARGSVHTPRLDPPFRMASREFEDEAGHQWPRHARWSFAEYVQRHTVRQSGKRREEAAE